MQASLAAKPQIVPPNLGLGEAQADLVALDALRPRLLQLQQRLERAEDTEAALGSDIIGIPLIALSSTASIRIPHAPAADVVLTLPDPARR